MMKDEMFLVFNANVEMVEYSCVSSGWSLVRSQDQPSSSVECLCWREEPAPGPVVLCNHLNKHYSAVIQLSGGKLDKNKIIILFRKKEINLTFIQRDYHSLALFLHHFQSIWGHCEGKCWKYNLDRINVKANAPSCSNYVFLQKISTYMIMWSTNRLHLNSQVVFHIPSLSHTSWSRSSPLLSQLFAWLYFTSFYTILYFPKPGSSHKNSNYPEEGDQIVKRMWIFCKDISTLYSPSNIFSLLNNAVRSGGYTLISIFSENQ